MTTIAIAVFTIAIGIALIASSYLYSKTRTEPFMFGAGTILLLLTGLIILTSPISYATGSTEEVTNTTTTITTTYTQSNTALNTATGLILILIGFFGTSSAIERFKLARTKEETEDRISFDD